MTRAKEKPTAVAGEARTHGAAVRVPVGTARDRAKADRRAALLAAAARLFAERGFDGVTLGDIGEAAGVSGPAVYRHVSSKQALLGAILVDVSARLLQGGRAVGGGRAVRDAPAVEDGPAVGDAPAAPSDGPARRRADAPSAAGEIPRTDTDVHTTDDPDTVLRALVDFHVAFAVAEADVIRVQDRDLDRLSPDDRRAVRDLQNAYVSVWTAALAARDGDAESPAERRVRALACFGLINSTPHSVRGVPAPRVRLTLTRMALAALTA
ncbi:TetR family transcriptional regulator [Microbacterium testaceum]|nr:TetR family transcriptional regulator [Microbacterium testaceum]